LITNPSGFYNSTSNIGNWTADKSNYALLSILNNGSYFNTASADTFIANYSQFLVNNQSLTNYIIYNNASIVNYILTQNNSLVNYIAIVNTSSNIDSLGYLNKSGTNANQNINISPYNLTTSNTGFFGWLGGLTSRITKLWIVDINATGNIETSQNMTATYVKLGGGGYMYDNGTTLIIGRD
jgi:hypothetical protein